jgi:hypothetical protein
VAAVASTSAPAPPLGSRGSGSSKGVARGMAVAAETAGPAGNAVLAGSSSGTAPCAPGATVGLEGTIAAPSPWEHTAADGAAAAASLQATAAADDAAGRGGSSDSVAAVAAATMAPEGVRQGGRPGEQQQQQQQPGLGNVGQELGEHMGSGSGDMSGKVAAAASGVAGIALVADSCAHAD